MERAETVKKCQLCELKTSSMSFLLRHLATVHSNRPGFFFSCGLNGCQRTFRNITTYKHHVYAKHSKDHTNLSTVTTSNPPTTDHDSDQSDDEDLGGMNDTGSPEHEDEQTGSMRINQLL